MQPMAARVVDGRVAEQIQRRVVIEQNPRLPRRVHRDPEKTVPVRPGPQMDAVLDVIRYDQVEQPAVARVLDEHAGTAAAGNRAERQEIESARVPEYDRIPDS